jgi:hypothetical protein
MDEQPTPHEHVFIQYAHPSYKQFTKQIEAEFPKRFPIIEVATVRTPEELVAAVGKKCDPNQIPYTSRILCFPGSHIVPKLSEDLALRSDSPESDTIYTSLIAGIGDQRWYKMQQEIEQSMIEDTKQRKAIYPAVYVAKAIWNEVAAQTKISTPADEHFRRLNTVWAYRADTWDEYPSIEKRVESHLAAHIMRELDAIDANRGRRRCGTHAIERESCLWARQLPHIRTESIRGPLNELRINRGFDEDGCLL